METGLADAQSAEKALSAIRIPYEVDARICDGVVHPLNDLGCQLACLNEKLFNSLAAAKEMLEAWQKDYNTHRPHSALSNLTPMEFAEKMTMDKLTA